MVLPPGILWSVLGLVTCEYTRGVRRPHLLGKQGRRAGNPARQNNLGQELYMNLYVEILNWN